MEPIALQKIEHGGRRATAAGDPETDVYHGKVNLFTHIGFHR
jgi:hypothetical protein